MIRNISAVLYDTDDILIHDIYDFHADESVIDQDRITRFYIFIKILVADRHLFLCSFNLIIYKSKLLSLFQRDLLLLKTSDPYFRTFRIKKSCNRLVELPAQCFQFLQPRFLFFMSAM